jgi:hypothetical protein
MTMILELLICYFIPSHHRAATTTTSEVRAEKDEDIVRCSALRESRTVLIYPATRQSIKEHVRFW